MHTHDLVRQWYESGWGDGNEEVLRRHAHDEIGDEWHGIRGLDHLVAVIEDLHRTFPDLSLEVTDQAGDDARVTTVWTMRGTDEGGLFSMDPTGRSVEITAICLDDVVTGGVIRHQQVSDMWRLLRQLEVIPAGWKADRPLMLPS